MQVSIRELKANLSRYLRQAAAGEALQITSHGRVVAQVRGVPDNAPGDVAKLLAAGAASWSGGKPSGARLRLQDNRKPISALVLEDRR
jgi:prevent-host-death family protein